MAKWHVHRPLFLIAVGIIVQTAPLPAASQAVSSAGQATTAKAQKLLDSGQFDDALEALDALAVHQPEAARTERLRGMAFYGMGQLQSSEQAFEKALIQDPADREAMQMEGFALFRPGRSADAIPFLERARLFIPSSNIDSNYVLGLCYLDTHRYDDARHAFTTQYRFSPDSPSAYLLAARMMLRRDYLPTAESAQRLDVVRDSQLPTGA